jgi:hypothetical protein
MKTKYNKEELIEAIRKSFSIAETCRNLSIRPSGGNYKTLNSLIKEHNIDITHFTGQGWNVGLKFRPMKTYLLEDILVEDSQYRSSYKLKNRLFENGIKQEKCEVCSNSVWNDKKIPLELHHINGVNTDNRIENLQILCCNCHGQTENFRKGKSALAEKREVECRKFKEASASNVGGNLEPSLRNEKGAETRHGTSKSKKPKRLCSLCDKVLKNNQTTYCSTECYYQGTKGKRPPVFELINKFKDLKTFVSVGKFYNVSDNAVRKWCSYYGILDMVKV